MSKQRIRIVFLRIAFVAILVYAVCVTIALWIHKGGSAKRLLFWEDSERSVVCNCAEIGLPNISKMVVPAECVVIQDPRIEGRAWLFMEKRVQGGGSDDSREKTLKEVDRMGCAKRLNDAQCMIATFGEWRSIDSGASVRLVLVIPSTVQIVRDERLGGWKSMAVWKPGDPEEERLPGSETDPNRTGIRRGWEVIRDHPDPNCYARDLYTASPPVPR